jgi:peptidoglycan hydrolase-like protein with peptidoglycan-binding domain
VTLFAWTKDAAGDISALVSQNVTLPDLIPPGIPIGLTAQPISSSEIDLSWNNSFDDEFGFVAGYTVSRDGVAIGTTTQLIFADTGLSPSTAHTYAVEAFDNSGNYSGATTASATTNSAPVVYYGGGSGGGGGGAPAYIYPPASTTATSTLAIPAAYLALKYGVTNSTVHSLQEFLNAHDFKVALTGAGSPGHETSYYGPATLAAFNKLKASLGTTTSSICPIGLTCTLNTPASVTVRCPPGFTCKPNNLATGISTSLIASSTIKASLFTRQLSPGMRNADVTNLQRFLNSQGFPIAKSGAGSVGHETNYYGPATANAVSKFQEYYSKDILIPYGMNKSTGQVGPATLKKINALIAQ